MGYYRTGAVSFARGPALPQMGYRPRRPRRTIYKKPQTGAPLRKGLRVRRGAKGATATRQRRRKINTARKTGDNSSLSYTKMLAKWNPQLKRLYRVVQARQTVASQAGGNSTCSVGRQNVTAFTCLSATTLGSLKANVNGGATDNAVRMFLGSAKLKVSLRNQTNSVAKITLYDIVCKRAGPSFSLDSPIEAWTKGYTDMGITNPEQILGQTPSHSPEFRNLFYTHKVTTFMMEPGQQHDHTFYRTINRVVDSTLWDNLQGQSCPGLTFFTMVVFNGTLIHESATPTTVTTCGVTLDHVFTFEIDYGFMQSNKPFYQQLAQVTNTIVDPDFMGETQDADVNVTSA